MYLTLPRSLTFYSQEVKASEKHEADIILYLIYCQIPLKDQNQQCVGPLILVYFPSLPVALSAKAHSFLLKT